MNETPYICRHCKNPLGVSSDKALMPGSGERGLVMEIIQPVKFKCGRCKRISTWRPLNSREIRKVEEEVLSPKICIPIPAYPVY